MTDLSDHPFSSESIAYETGDDGRVRVWMIWCIATEALLGHGLDGNDVNAAGCGYSLDEALDYFEQGNTPAEYAEAVKSRPRYKRDVPAETFAQVEAHERWKDRAS